jgi:hypothetical protein
LSSVFVGVPNRLMGLRRSQRLAVERSYTPGEGINKLVEVVVIERAVHPSITLDDVSIEIVAAEYDLQCPRVSNQAWKPFQCSAAWDQPDADAE